MLAVLGVKIRWWPISLLGLACGAAGALIGAGIFEITQQGGRWVFAGLGAILGVMTMLAIRFYSRAARLTEVRVMVPRVSEFKFVVNDESREVAWKLFVETITRVSTQPLDPGEGLVREALSSLHSLFASTRDILKASRPSVSAPGDQTVEHLAITMLNRELRPFLSKWHPRLREFERDNPQQDESMWTLSSTCREELKAVQQRIHAYALGFAKLAGVHEAQSMMVLTGSPTHAISEK